MKVAILSSSRADFGIYYPLVKILQEDSFFELEIIVFGTHLEKKFGFTIDEILSFGFEVSHTINTHIEDDTSEGISKSIGNTMTLFSEFWERNSFDLVFAIGDRYEMFAAVSAATPFNISIAHIHAGETTLGAIDNIYRHCITLMSEYIFVTTEEYKKRAASILGRSDKIFNVGALSIDNLHEQEFYTKDEFLKKFQIDMNRPTILTTFHPETVSYEKNVDHISELIPALDCLSKEFQIVITLPNSDTMGDMIRDAIICLSNKNNQSLKVVKSFGMKGYLSCMKYCSLLLGNTSSGFVEASYFPKWVINLGDRQEGRILTENIITIPIQKRLIIKTVKETVHKNVMKEKNIYGSGDAGRRMINLLKKEFKKDK